MIKVAIHALKGSLEKDLNSDLKEFQYLGFKIIDVKFSCSDEWMHAMIIYDTEE